MTAAKPHKRLGNCTISNKQGGCGSIRLCCKGQRGQGVKGPPFDLSTLAECFMNKRVSWEFLGVNGDELARMRLIWPRDLQSKTALGTANQYGLTLAQIMKPLEKMNAPKRNVLDCSAVSACKRDHPEPCAHDHPGAGCQTG
jgi:hypothetical protein